MPVRNACAMASSSPSFFDASTELQDENNNNPNNALNNNNDMNQKDDTNCSEETATSTTANIKNNEASYYVGQYVIVKPRTWPGMNKPGGAGRIVGVSTCSNFVTVNYTICRKRDTDVDIKYVQHDATMDNLNRPIADMQSLRDRSMLLGRCLKCGSLRTDCKSCDFANDYGAKPLVVSPSSQRKEQENRRSRKDYHVDSVLVPDKSNEVSSDDDLVDEMVKENDRRHRSFRRFKARAQKIRDRLECDNNSTKKCEKEISIIKPRHSKKIRRKRKRTPTQSWNVISRTNETKQNEPNATSDDDDDEYDETLHQLAKKCSSIRRKTLPLYKIRRQICADSSSSSDGGLEDESEIKKFQMSYSDNTNNESQTLMVDTSNPGSPDLSPARGNCEFSPQASSPSYQHHSDDDRSMTMDIHDDSNNNRSDNNENNLYGFIQPEGDAEQLPADIADRTSTLSYGELGPFFDSTAELLEKRYIPEAKLQVYINEQDFRKIQNPLGRQQSILFTTLSISDIVSFRVKCQILHDNLIRTLIQEESDQCQSALRRLSSKRLYKAYKASLKNSSSPSSNPSKSVQRKLDVRGFRLDAINAAIEELLNRLRKLLDKLNDVEQRYGDETDSDNGHGDTQPHRDDGSVVPNTSDSPTRLLETDRLATNVNLTLDPHPYASKKRIYSDNYQQKARRQRNDHLTQSHEASTSDHGATSRSLLTNGKGGKSRPRDNNIGKSLKKNRINALISNEDDNMSESKQQNAGQRQRNSASNQSHDSRERNEDDEISHPDLGQTIESDLSVGSMELSDDNNNQSDGQPRTSTVSARRRPLQNIPDFIAPGPSNRFATVGGKITDRESIAERMQKFLDANNENREISSDVRPPSKPKETVCNNHRARDTTRSLPTSRNSSSIGVMKDELFATLRTLIENTTLGYVQENLNNAYSGEVPDLCKKLAETFPLNGCKALLAELCKQLVASSSVSQMYAKSVFQVFLTTLRRHRRKTLQYLVSSESPSLGAHVALLTSILTMFKAGVNKYLTPSCGDVYVIFSPENIYAFVDFVVLQLVDTLMSLVHPKNAWALDIADLQGILFKLEPLRNELGQIVCLAEKVSKCITSELGIQKWRCDIEREYAFVSSVDPTDWEMFLLTAAKPSRTTEIRYQAFDKKLPSCEIDAVWSVLAYIAPADAKVQDTDTSKRWKLVTKLLNESALSKETTTNELPPCEDQIQAASADIRNLTTLLILGTMGCSARQDIIKDLIVRIVLLQAHGILHNEMSRENAYPTVANEELASDRVRSLWHEYDDVDTLFNSSLKHVATSLGNMQVDSIWMDQPLYLPSSLLLRQTLGLLIAWLMNIPRDQLNYYTRFEKVKEQIVRSFSRQHSLVINDQKNTNHDGKSEGPLSFLEAFSSSTATSTSKCGQGEIRQGLFLLESAAYLTLFSKLVVNVTCRNTTFDLKELSDEIWGIVADSTLKTRQELVYSDDNCDSRSSVFLGDSFRLFLAARVITCLSLMGLGIGPVQEGLTTSDSLMNYCVNAHEFNKNAFDFLLSCLLTCLDCSCDSDQNVEVMASVIGCLAVTLKSFYNWLHKSGVQDARRSTRYITKNLCIKTMKIFERSFKIITSASKCRPEEDVCLRSLLCFIRWFFAVNDCVPTSDAAFLENTVGNDDFGGIDDAMFANIDLNQINGGQTYPKPSEISRSERRITFDFLVEALEHGRPSAAFAPIETNLSYMSVQGKQLVSRNTKLICRCLAQLIASDFSPPFYSIGLLKLPTNNLPGDDKVYKRQVSHSFAKELCCFVNSTQIKELVRSKADCLICVLVEALLDHEFIRKVPSCNLPRIQLLSGESGENKALFKLMEFCTGKNQNLIQTVNKIHWFCTNVGTILLDSPVTLSKENDWLDVWSVDSDLNHEWRVPLEPSLEQECFNCFRLFRRVLNLAESQELSINFELISLSMISASAENLLQIIDLIVVQSKAHANTTKRTFRYAKLMEMFSCCTEIFVSLLSLVLRPRKRALQESLSGYLIRICERFISPLLKNQCYDIRAGLFAVVNIASNSALIHHESAALECDELCDIMRDSLTKKMRDFFLFAISCKQHASFLNDYFSFVVKNKTYSAEMVSYAFSLQGYSYERSENDSPLRVEINEYMSLVEKSNPLGQNYIEELKDQKQKFYKLLVPWLSKSDNGSKLAIINALGYLLDTENKERQDVIMDPLLLCSIGKGIVASLHSCLASPSIDENVVGSLFSSAWSLMNVPASSVEVDTVGFLVDWCYTISCSEESNHTPHAKYLWYLCNWLKDVGNFIVGSDPKHVQAFRFKLRETVSSATDQWDIQIPGQAPTIAENLIELECTIFGRTQNPCKPKNMYDKSKESISTESFDKWVNSEAVRECVVKFTSKVSTACKVYKRQEQLS